MIGDPRIPDQHLKSIVVPQQSKAQLLDYLKRLGLSTRALFGDVPGLAAANTTRTQFATNRSAIARTVSAPRQPGLSGWSIRGRSCSIRIVRGGAAGGCAAKLPQRRRAHCSRTIRGGEPGVHTSDGESRSTDLSWRTNDRESGAGRQHDVPRAVLQSGQCARSDR